MKTLYQLEQEAKEARDNAIFLHGSESPLSQDIVDSFINAAVAMVTYQLALGMQEVSGDGSGEDLPEVSQEQRDSDGWIDWNGEGTPKLIYVDVKLRSGAIIKNSFVGEFRWWHSKKQNANDNIYSSQADIVAYRMVAVKIITLGLQNSKVSSTLNSYLPPL